MGSNKFCAVPFLEINFYLYRFGNSYNRLGATPCCSGWIESPFSLAVIPVNENEEDIDIMSSWNSDMMKNFRESIIDGSYRYCKKEECPYYYSGKLMTLEGEAVKYVENKIVEVKEFPSLIRLSIDYKCNLQCPSCRGRRYSEENDSTYKRIKIFLSKAKRLYLNGNGELFSNKQILRALRGFSEKKYPNLEEISFITNGTLLNKSMWYSLPEDLRKRVVEIIVSVDSFDPDVYKKIRVGGNFDILYKNLLFLSDLRKNKEIKKLTLVCVLQNANIKEIDSYVENVVKLGVDSLLLNRISNWYMSKEDFSKINLPYDWEKIYKKEIDRAKDIIRNSNLNFVSNIIKI